MDLENAYKPATPSHQIHQNGAWKWLHCKLLV